MIGKNGLKLVINLVFFSCDLQKLVMIYICDFDQNRSSELH